MRAPTRTDLAALVTDPRPPCISLYLPTDRSYPAEQQGPIRYKNALRTVEEALRRQFSGADVRGLMGRFVALTDDQFFWTHRHQGLAVFGSRDLFEIFDLQTQP